MLLTADALLYFLNARCFDALLRLGDGRLFVTRLVLDTLDRQPRPPQLNRYGPEQVVTITLDPDESRQCTQLWLEGWDSDLASVAAIASRRGWWMVHATAEIPPLANLRAVHCAEMLLRMAEERLISIGEADRYLGRMKRLGLDSPLATIDPPTFQRWQRRELTL